MVSLVNAIQLIIQITTDSREKESKRAQNQMGKTKQKKPKAFKTRKLVFLIKIKIIPVVYSVIVDIN